MLAGPDPKTPAGTSLVLGGAALLLATGCGGATPLLHPAHTLAPGKVTFGAGASGTFLAGQAKASLDDARAVTTSGGTASDAELQKLAEGTMTSVLATPGLAPWVGARVGIAERTEAGAAYTGHWARVDVRHSFEDRKLALSLGVAALALLSHPSADPAEPSGTSGAVAGVDGNGVYGFGFNVPVIVGYRSDAELVQAWGGLVGTFESAFGPVMISDGWPNTGGNTTMLPGVAEVRLDAHRISGAALLGLAVGVDPIWVAIEISGRYFALDGKLHDESATALGEVTGFSIEPAGALLGRF
jgi:hypothetical protein